MGLVTSQIRLIYLNMYRHDLEYKIQFITQTKMNLTNNMLELVQVGSYLDPDSPEVRMLEQRKKRLELIEKKLDAEIERFKTMLNAVTTEIQSAEKMVEQNVKSSFTYGPK